MTRFSVQELLVRVFIKFMLKKGRLSEIDSKYFDALSINSWESLEAYGYNYPDLIYGIILKLKSAGIETPLYELDQEDINFLAKQIEENGISIKDELTKMYQ